MTTNYYIHQAIFISQFKVGGVSNSSVLQIGSVGSIKPVGNYLNTGQFTQTAPKLLGMNESIFNPKEQLKKNK